MAFVEYPIKPLPSSLLYLLRSFIIQHHYLTDKSSSNDGKNWFD